MNIIEIQPLSSGAHRNQKILGTLSKIPDGWAVIPEEMAIPETFPFVEFEVTGNVVTAMTAGILPEPELEPEIEAEPTTEELLNIILGVSE